MRDQCPFATFDCCDCSGECESAAVPIIHIKDRHDARRERDVLIEQAFLRTLVVAFFGIATLSLVFVGAPESQRIAKAEQENTYVKR